MIRRIIVLFFVLFLITGSVFSKPLEQEVKKEFNANGISGFMIKNINGKINVITSSSLKIRIRAIKKAKTEEKLKALKIIFNEDKRSISCIVKHGSWLSNPGSVDFEVELPKNFSSVKLTSVNGGISIKGSYGDLNIRTVNGKINFEGSSNNINFKTVNGAIAYYNEEILNGDLSFKTVNGRIVMELNKNSSFKVKCSTVNGDINSEFDFRIIEGFVGARMTGEINSGKYSVNASTVNGSIKINKF